MSDEGGDRVRRKSKKKKSNRHRRRSLSDSSSDSNSSNSSDSDDPFTFEKAAKSSGKQLSKEATEIRNTVDEYRKRGIKKARLAFSRLENNETDFPESLYPDLLQYQYIDLEKIMHEIYSQSSSSNVDQQVLKINTKTQSIETSSKAQKRSFTNSGEWRKALSVLRKSMCLAFPCAVDSFKAYFRHIKEMETTFTRWGNWKEAVAYDADMRKALAQRTHLSFADYNHEELLFVRTRKPAASSSSNQTASQVQTTKQQP